MSYDALRSKGIEISWHDGTLSCVMVMLRIAKARYCRFEDRVSGSLLGIMLWLCNSCPFLGNVTELFSEPSGGASTA